MVRGQEAGRSLTSHGIREASCRAATQVLNCKSFANQLRVQGWYALERIGTNDPTHRYETGRPGTGWDGPLARQDMVVASIPIVPHHCAVVSEFAPIPHCARAAMRPMHHRAAPADPRAPDTQNGTEARVSERGPGMLIKPFATRTPSYERLSPRDASFLAYERNGLHMHVGVVAIFEDTSFRTSTGLLDFEKLGRYALARVARVRSGDAGALASARAVRPCAGEVERASTIESPAPARASCAQRQRRRWPGVRCGRSGAGRAAGR